MGDAYTKKKLFISNSNLTAFYLETLLGSLQDMRKVMLTEKEKSTT